MYCKVHYDLQTEMITALDNLIKLPNQNNLELRTVNITINLCVLKNNCSLHLQSIKVVAIL